MNKPICKTCKETYPQKRKDMGYTVCVKCSTEPGWSCSALTYHKTGNTIQIIKDPEVAHNINAMAQRKSFGVMSGITGRYSKYRKESNVPKRKPKYEDQTGLIIEHRKQSMGVLNGITKDFNKTGKIAIDILESKGLDKAKEFIRNEYHNLDLSPNDFTRLMAMVKLFNEQSI